MPPQNSKADMSLTEEQLKELLSAVVPVKPETRAPLLWITSQSDVDYFSQMPLFVINFKAEWCGVCKAYAPIFESVADECEYNGTYFGYCDVDEYSDIVQRFGITSIPVTVFISGGNAMNAIYGFLPKSQLEYYVEWHHPNPNNGQNW